jgi:hypothetical protein
MGRVNDVISIVLILALGALLVGVALLLDRRER